MDAHAKLINNWIIYILVILIYSRSTSNFLHLGISRPTALILECKRVSIRKGIWLKSDVPDHLFVAGSPSYRQLIGKYRRKTLTTTTTNYLLELVVSFQCPRILFTKHCIEIFNIKIHVAIHFNWDIKFILICILC